MPLKTPCLSRCRGSLAKKLSTALSQEADPSPPHMLLRTVPRPDHAFQPFPVARTKPDFDALSHPDGLAYPRAGWNHSSVPIH